MKKSCEKISAISATLYNNLIFPTEFNFHFQDDDIIEKVNDLKSTIKFQMKKVSSLSVAIDNVSMSKDELVQNTFAVKSEPVIVEHSRTAAKVRHMYLGDQPPVVLDATKRNSKDAIKPSAATFGSLLNKSTKILGLILLLIGDCFAEEMRICMTVSIILYFGIF